MSNKSLSRVILFVSIVFFTAIIYTAEFNLAQSGKNDVEKNNSVFYADLTHDGKEEKIVVDTSQLENTQNVIVTVYTVENGTEKPIWTDVAGVPMAGWNSYYLYKSDDAAYLIRYNPSITNTGVHYSYEIFWLNEDGSEIPFAGNSILFHLTNKATDLDPDKIIDFVNEVNRYLKKSILLVSTYNGDVIFSTSDHPIVLEETLPWTKDYTYLFQGNETLIEKLRKIKSELEKSS